MFIKLPHEVGTTRLNDSITELVMSVKWREGTPHWKFILFLILTRSRDRECKHNVCTMQNILKITKPTLWSDALKEFVYVQYFVSQDHKRRWLCFSAIILSFSNYFFGKHSDE